MGAASTSGHAWSALRTGACSRTTATCGTWWRAVLLGGLAQACLPVVCLQPPPEPRLAKTRGLRRWRWTMKRVQRADASDSLPWPLSVDFGPVGQAYLALGRVHAQALHGTQRHAQPMAEVCTAVKAAWLHIGRVQQAWPRGWRATCLEALVLPEVYFVHPPVRVQSCCCSYLQNGKHTALQATTCVGRSRHVL